MKKNNLLFFGSWLFMLFLVLGATTTQAAHEHPKDANNYSVFSTKHCLTCETVNNRQTQEFLKKTPAWTKFVQKNGNWFVNFDPVSQLPMRAAGAPIATVGTTPEAQARNFIATELQGFNIPSQALFLAKVNTNDKMHYVNFKQYHQGIEVLGSQMSVHIWKQNNTIASFVTKLHPSIQMLSVAPTLTTETIKPYVIKNLKGNYNEVIVQNDLKILPIPNAQNFDYKLVYTAFAKGKDAENKPANYFTLVDAHTGEVYYRQNRVCFFDEHDAEQKQSVGFTIKGNVMDNPNYPATKQVLPYVRVKVGGQTYYTDANGVLEYEGTLPAVATVFLDGKFAKVVDENIDNDTPSFDIELTENQTTVNLGNALSENPAVAGYKHTTTVHEHMKANLPADFTTMDVPMYCYVNRTDGSCNAYYDGTINFYAEADGCFSTSLFNDIVYHEYGHGINYDFYTYLNGDWANGSLGEGYADVWAINITENPIMSEGFNIGDLNSYIRCYKNGQDGCRRQCPNDIVGEVHSDGEIIGGAWWDLMELIGFQPAFDIFVNSHFGVPMRFDGEECLLYTDILLEALVADDDNGNLADGTPNSEAILEAFANHGITFIVSTVINNETADNAPANQPIPINFTLDIDFQYENYLGIVECLYRTNRTQPYTSVPATYLGGNDYKAEIPAQPEGTIVDYYFKANDQLGSAYVVTPSKADNTDDPNIPFQTLVGFTALQTENFSAPGDWTLGVPEDDAATGFWEISSPSPTFVGSAMVQPNKDHTTTTDNQCAFTANGADPQAPGSNDIDDGKVSLLSFVYDVKTLKNPVFSYYRYYSNDQGANPGNDPMRSYISNDGGNNWVRIENTYRPDHSWRMNAFKIKDYVDLSAFVMLKFEASDSLMPGSGLEYDGGSLVELLIDDVVLYDEASAVGVENTPLNTALNIAVFPNPVLQNSNLYVQANKQLSGNTTVQMFNAVGQKVIEKSTQILANQNFTINTQGLTAGVYLLKIKNGNLNTEQRVLIK